MMPGFKNNAINIAFENGILNRIARHIVKCCSEMKSDCVSNGKLLYNHEDKISNRLVANYLNRGPNIIRYELQVPENFNPDEDRYIGRLDIRVCSLNRFAKNADDYYIIECKRVDGGARLNKVYIIEGVCRFVSDSPKYASYRQRNMMLGYVVNPIDIPQNTAKIASLQSVLLNAAIPSNFVLIDSIKSEYYIYSCQYELKSASIELRHIFYDLSNAICKNCTECDTYQWHEQECQLID